MPWAEAAGNAWSAALPDETVVGVDVGGTKVLAALVSGSEVLTQQVRPTPERSEDLIDAVVDVVGVVSGGGHVAPRAVGMGVPGFVDLGGVPRQAPNLPAIVDVDVGGVLAERLGLPVVVDNDANCAARAAAAHDAPGVGHVILVTFGTGIGAGLVVDGKLVRGAHGFAGEPGHMVVDTEGPQCVCGQHGCWEMFASGNAIGRMARELAASGRATGLLEAAGGHADAIDGRLVAQRSAGGDPDAEEVLDRHAKWVAVGLVNLINLLDPAVVVLGGGVVAQGEPFRRRVVTEVERLPTMGHGRAPDIRISTFGPAAGAVGAAMAARELVEQPASVHP